jgi:hypothetical protein
MGIVAATSPFSCRWIQRGSETRVSNWSLAVCVRLRDNPCIVAEEECARCALWHEADSHGSSDH